jgi:transposase-like protein
MNQTYVNDLRTYFEAILNAKPGEVDQPDLNILYFNVDGSPTEQYFQATKNMQYLVEQLLLENARGGRTQEFQNGLKAAYAWFSDRLANNHHRYQDVQEQLEAEEAIIKKWLKQLQDEMAPVGSYDWMVLRHVQEDAANLEKKVAKLTAERDALKDELTALKSLAPPVSSKSRLIDLFKWWN